MSMDIEELRGYERRGLVRCSAHPTKNLLVWNYTDLAQRERAWDRVTNATRALVTDRDGRIVARSFPKFHDLEHGLHRATPEFTVWEKIDGSLIVVFWHEGEWVACSRGSFVSPQAVWAADRLRRHPVDMTSLTSLTSLATLAVLDPADVAYSFEAVYPANRIVIDYGAFEGLVFLAAFRRDGEEVPPDVAAPLLRSCGFEVAKRHDFDDYGSLKALDWANAEGFVVRFANGDRAKVKFDGYNALHWGGKDGKAGAGLDEAGVWEMFRKGDRRVIDDGVPAEFRAWAAERWDALAAARDAVLRAAELALREVEGRTEGSGRAVLARNVEAVSEERGVSKALLFAMRSGKDAEVRALAAKLVKPTAPYARAVPVASE